MNLQVDNFKIKIIYLDINNNINDVYLDNQIDGFTNSNSATILGSENIKNKIMFNDIRIPNNTKFIIFQLSIFYNDKYYNPYLFFPIKNENDSCIIELPGRALSFKLNNNIFSYIWFYITTDSVENIINTFKPSDKITDSYTYIKEYIMINNFKI